MRCSPRGKRPLALAPEALKKSIIPSAVVSAHFIAERICMVTYARRPDTRLQALRGPVFVDKRRSFAGRQQIFWKVTASVVSSASGGPARARLPLAEVVGARRRNEKDIFDTHAE